MKNIRAEAKNFAIALNYLGFKGVPIHAEVEGPDEPEPDEQTTEQKAEFDRDYVAMIVEPLFMPNMDDEKPYESRTIDAAAFWRDLIAWMQRRLGKDVSFKHNTGCNEIEIHRKK